MDQDMEQSLNDFHTYVNNQGKEAREKLEKGFYTLKTKAESLKMDKLKSIDSWESGMANRIADLLSKIKLAKMANEQNIKLEPDFNNQLWAAFQQLKKDLDQNQLKVEMISSDQFIDHLLQFCKVEYVPTRKSGPQDLPQPNIQQKPNPILPQHENIQPKSPSQIIPESQDLIENFLNLYRKYKHATFRPTLESAIPDQLLDEAKLCVGLPIEKKFTFVNFYTIIINNLNEGKELIQIREGFWSLAKLAICLYLSPNLEEIISINTEHGFFKQNIDNNVSGVQEIFRVFGYEFHQNKLELGMNPERQGAQIERMGCELFILLQEISEIAEKRSQHRELLSHFNMLAQKVTLPNLQQNTNIRSTQQPIPEKTKYGFQKESPFGNEPMDESKHKIDDENEDDQGFALSELMVAISTEKEQSIKATLEDAAPEPFLELTKKITHMPLEERYKHFPIHQIIYTNLTIGKGLYDIKAGFVGIFKYVFCIIMNKENPEISQFMYDQGQFKRFVSDNIGYYHDVFEKFGYEQDPTKQVMHLSKFDPKHELKLLSMCCEFLVAIQELNEFNPNIHGDPTQYFKPQKQELPIKNREQHSSGPKIEPHPGISTNKSASSQIEAHPTTQFQSQPNFPNENPINPNIQSKKEPSNFETTQSGLPPPISQQQMHSNTQSQNNDPMMQRKFQSAQAQLNVQQEQIIPHQQYPDQLPMPTLTPSQHIQPKSLPPEVNSLHQSIRNLREKNIKVYIHNTIPGELPHLAGQCVKLEAPNKFSHSIVCELIIANLSDKRTISDVRDGLRNMAQFALCIFTNTVDSTTHTNFKAGTVFFGLPKEPLSGADQIFPFLGYDYDQMNRNFLLNREKLVMPETNETIVFLVSDLLMAEQDLKTFEYIGVFELIKFYQKYPGLSQIPESKNQSQTYSGPHQPANQSQYSSTNTPLDTTPQMHQHSGSHSQIPPSSSHRTGFEGQYASGTTGSGQIHQQMQGYPSQPGLQQRLPETDPNNFNIPAQSSSGYNAPQRYGQDPQMFYPQSTGDLPSGVPFHPGPSQPSGGSTHSVTGREWSCPHCTALNAFNTRVCHVCARTPDSKSGQTPGQSAPETQASKICGHCRQMSRMQEVNCFNCGASFM